MSFNRLNYDTGTYKKELNQSVGPGVYHLNKPQVTCTPCYPIGTNLQKSGASVNKNMNMVDLDSELMGLFRKNSRNPDRKFKPNYNDIECDNGEPQGNSISSSCSYNVKLNKDSKVNNLLHWKDCFSPAEDTRISNPPCNLREIGFNRFDFLHSNPQKNIEKPFANNICNRTIVKDNHRPIIPTLIGQDLVLPCQKKINVKMTKPVRANNINPNSTNWSNCIKPPRC